MDIVKISINMTEITATITRLGFEKITYISPYLTTVQRHVAEQLNILFSIDLNV